MHHLSDLDTFHGGQTPGKFQTRTDVVFLERMIILQNFMVGLPGGNRPHNIGHKNPRATHHRFSVANGGIETDPV